MKINKEIITIIGSGAWGSTLKKIIENNNYLVRTWSRSSKKSLESLIHNSNLLVSAISMGGVRPTIEKLKTINISRDLIIVTATKGLDAIDNCTPSLIWQKAFPYNPIVVLSGPNLSAEIQQNLPAATVIASHDLIAAKKTQSIFASLTFRVYVNSDPLGTELGGTLKNIMAIAAGVCDGMELGVNAKAALLTRALAEMVRVGSYLGAKPETFFGLSGLGDLIATCNGCLSRNYQVGYELAKGKSKEQILQDLQGTAEGINTTQVLTKIALQENISLPITVRVSQLLQGEITPSQAVKALMERDLTLE